MLCLIATCMWNLHHALWVMDHAGLVLRDDEAEDGFPKKDWCFFNAQVQRCWKLMPHKMSLQFGIPKLVSVFLVWGENTFLISKKLTIVC